MKLALGIIAKDEVEKVQNIINLYGKYFDEIAVACDERLNEFASINCDKLNVFEYKWINDFSDKRNFLAKKINSEYYFRLDTDDLLIHPELIPQLFQKISQDGVDILYLLYNYAKDENGDYIAVHWRESIIRKRPDIYWKKSIHENIYTEDRESVRIAKDEIIQINHMIDNEHAEASFQRNLKYLIEEFKRDGERTDPRTIAYIGRMLAGKGIYQEAILFLEKLVERSGWDDDKYFAYIQMSQCYHSLQKYDMAIACANEALAINTQFPDAYLQLGNIYLDKQEYGKSVDWYMSGIVRPAPDTVMVLDPCLYQYKAKVQAAMALLGKGDIQMASRLFGEAQAKSPNNPMIKKYAPLFFEALEEDTYLKNLVAVGKYVAGREPKLLKSLADSVPNDSLKSERVCLVRNHLAGVKRWDDKSIVFYCGNAWESWADCSVLGGIGGSEEAVIYLSREFVKLGYNVTIYNQCDDLRGIYNGIEYKNYFEFNPDDKFNVLIGWRNNIFKARKFNAKFSALWLHDVPMEDSFTERTMGNMDKVIVLSQYHRSLLPSYIAEEKVLVSANGINLEDFKDYKLIRNSKRMIYTSSYDRGIQHLLQVWSEIKAEVPDAELHLFYGWDTYDKMMEKGMRPPAFKQKMVELMKQDGITEHGRVGHKQLNKEFQKSGLWVYPSHFEEISCISAMKAQANGCIPVCTNYAALAETVKKGVIIEGNCKDQEIVKEFKESIIRILKDEETQESIRQELLCFKESFSWELVAQQWNETFSSVEGGVLVA